jgi:hypothetical protein
MADEEKTVPVTPAPVVGEESITKQRENLPAPVERPPAVAAVSADAKQFRIRIGRFGVFDVVCEEVVGKMGGPRSYLRGKFVGAPPPQLAVGQRFQVDSMHNAIMAILKLSDDGTFVSDDGAYVFQGKAPA